MSTKALISVDSAQADFADIPVPAANVPAVSTGTLILLSDVITALGTLQASHNDLLAKLKASGQMEPNP